MTSRRKRNQMETTTPAPIAITYATKNDLDLYALRSDLLSLQNELRSNYQQKGDALNSILSEYAKSANLANYQPKGDYILNSTLSEYAKSSDLANFQPKGDYELKKPSNWAGNHFSKNGRCGPSWGDKACTGKACCSTSGWCGGSTGGNDDWCGRLKGFNGEYNGEKP